MQHSRHRASITFLRDSVIEESSETLVLDENDPNLPYPLNIRNFNTIQLAYLFNTFLFNTLSYPREMRNIAKDTALEMIELFSHAHVVTSEHLANILPLATMEDSGVLKELLNVMVGKIRNEALISHEKLSALAMIINYADKDFLKADDVMEIIEIIATRLSKIKVQDPLTVTRGVHSLNVLLDAAMTLQVIDVNPAKVSAILICLDSLKSDTQDPLRNVAVTYAQQAFLRVTEQKTDWEAGLAASYDLVNGVMALGCAVLDKSPGDIINSIITIYGAGQGVAGAMAGAQYAWFGHARTMKLLAQLDFKKFLAYLEELLQGSESRSQRLIFSFSSSRIPKELIFCLIQLLDSIIRDSSNQSCIDYTSNEITRETSVREIALQVLSQTYTEVYFYGQHADVRSLILEKFYQYCSLPEPELQRQAKALAQHIYQMSNDKKQASFISSFRGKKAVSPSQYWGSEAAIIHQPADNHFVYCTVPVASDSSRVEAAFSRKFPLLYLIEEMRYQTHELMQTSLREDMSTYVSVNASVSATKKELFELLKATESFINNRDDSVLLIHGNAGSGKTLFGRYLQDVLWKRYCHKIGCLPVFVTLPALKDPANHAIQSSLMEVGFSEIQISELRSSRQQVVFILDGFDEMQTKLNLYQSNQFSQWNCKVIITARTEYLQSLGNYHAYFSESRQKPVSEYYIRPFDFTQRQSFFQKMIDKGLSEWHQVSDYEESIASIPRLSELINTPFMLRIVTETLPLLIKGHIKKTVTRAIIYNAFTELEFQQNRDKLRKIASQPNGLIKIPVDFDEVTSFRKYSMSLAVNMFIRGMNSIITQGNDFRFAEEVHDYWDNFFDSNNPVLVASRLGSPLISAGRQRAFRHKSLLEYFTAKMFMRELENILKFNEPLKTESFFNQRPLHEEPSVLRFMLDMFAENAETESTLWGIIEQSKRNEHVAIATGNAMTLLVELKRSFAKKDLAGIHSKGAKVDFGDFTGTDFSEAHFEDTSWDGATLDEANFSHAHFKNNLIEERAAFSGGNIFDNYLSLDLDRDNLLLATDSDKFYLWHDGDLLSTHAGFGKCCFISSSNQRWVMIIVGTAGHLFDAFQRKIVKVIPSLIKESVVFNDHYCLYLKNKQQFSQIMLSDKSLSERDILFSGSALALDADTPFSQIVSITANQFIVSFKRRGFEFFTLSELLDDKLQVSTYKQCDGKKFFALPNSSYMMSYNDKRKELRFLAIHDFMEQVIPLLENRRIEEFGISPQGQYLLTKTDKQVTVFLIQSESNIYLQQLYHVDEVTNKLNAAQFSPDERYIAWGLNSVVQITKAREAARVQVIHLVNRNPVVNISFDQKGQALIMFQYLGEALLRARVEVNEQYEDDYIQHKDSDSVQLLSALGANFLGAEGLSKEDTALMKERGCLFETEESLIEQYESVTESVEKQAILFKALASRYRQFVQRFTWNKNLQTADGDTITHYLINQQRRDGDYVDYLNFLSDLGMLPIDTRNTNNSTPLNLAAAKGHLNTCNFLIIKEAKIDHGSFTPLISAVINGHYDVCQFLLEKGAQVDGVVGANLAPLVCAASIGNYDICQLFLNYGANVNLEDRYRATPLFEAARKGHEAVCRLLLERGANINHESSALHIAAKNGFNNICKLLIDKGAAINQVCRIGDTSLIAAISAGHREVCDFLIQSGADVNLVSNSEKPPLEYAVENGDDVICALLIKKGARVTQNLLSIAAPRGHTAVCKVLIENEADIEVEDFAPLCSAAAKGHLDTCQLLIEKRANVNESFPDGTTPLLIAAERGYLAICQLLIQNGATIDSVNLYGHTALYKAVDSGNIAICQLLIESNAKVDQAFPRGETLLLIAVKKGDLDTCQLLIARGAIIDQTDLSGSTPLIVAAKLGHVAVCQILLEHGANPNQTDSDGHPPLSWAVWNKKRAICECLLAFKAINIDHSSLSGKTALYRAIDLGDVAITGLLIEKGADLTKKTPEGKTYLDFAQEKGNEEIIALFEALRFGTEGSSLIDDVVSEPTGKITPARAEATQSHASSAARKSTKMRSELMHSSSFFQPNAAESEDDGVAESTEKVIKK